jgi:hypothetical protein
VALERRSGSVGTNGTCPMFYCLPTLHDYYVVCWNDRVRISAWVLNIIIIVIIIITAIEFSLGGSSPDTSTDKTNMNKYT